MSPRPSRPHRSSRVRSVSGRAGAKHATPASPAPAAAPGDLLALDEAVALLKTSRPTLYRWLRTGQIKAAKIGKQWRFRRADLERCLAGQHPPVILPTDIGPLLDDLRHQLAELQQPTDVDDPDADDSLRAVLLLIRLAHASQASDLHLEALLLDDQRVAVARCRIHGVLQEVARFDIRLLDHLVDRCKTLAGCNVNDRVRPQDGRTHLRVAGQTLDLRVSCLPATLGPTVTIRLLDPQAVLLSLDRIDYSPEVRQHLDHALRQSWGLGLITGPTGSGKTTVLYACLNQLIHPGVKVLSVEDPVEYVLPGVVQVPVRPSEGVTFAAALRSFLRCDPDVLMVGEIRDLETLQICCQAALTGHLVLSTLHTQDAGEALQRLLDIGVPPFLVASTLKFVLAQRLLRVLCPHCKRPGTPPAGSWALLNRLAGHPSAVDAGPGYCTAAGCPQCAQTGYQRRTVVAELLTMTPALGEALRQQVPAAELRAIAMSQGMTCLAADGLRRALAGQTTVEEVLRVVPTDAPA